ncbi:MAG: tRNA-guanine transglycosylase DpdA [Candidatus Thorarchaeota archaeon]
MKRLEISLNLRLIDPRKVSYFIPWWDDYVDLNYDFESDRPTDGVKVTAHQLYDSPPYDGILVSKVKIEDNKKRMKQVVAKGIHKFLEFNGPIFGDCGAYGYIKEKDPPFNPRDIADYYNDIKFDYGVSVDHLIVPAVEDEKEYRFGITIKNAEKFFHRHNEKGYDYVPVGAAQGWGTQSYREAVRELMDIGYDYIAIGGLTRSQTPEVMRIMQSVKEELPHERRIRVHLFGVARLNAIRELRELGLTSFDSASHLRRAWLGAGSNYILPKMKGYSALRVPQSDLSPKARRIIQNRGISEEELSEYEKGCMDLIRSYDKGEADIDEVLEALIWYDSLMGDSRNHADLYRKTLSERPWKQCKCRICTEWGVEVIVFRGNNRNRRRGFHNTRIFYDELQEKLGGTDRFQQARLDDL